MIIHLEYFSDLLVIGHRILKEMDLMVPIFGIKRITRILECLQIV